MRITYLDLLNKIDNKVINPYNYFVLYDNEEYNYNGMYFETSDRKRLLLNFIGEGELINTNFDLISKIKETKNIEYQKNKDLRRAKKRIIEELWNSYLEEDWNIQVTQGCTSDLDIKYKKLIVYEKLLAFLGVNVLKEKDTKFSSWYSEQIKKQKEKEKEKDKMFERLGYDWDSLILIDTIQYGDKIKDILIDIIWKVNEILNYLEQKEVSEKRNKDVKE